jgi:hypothetical protein
VTYDPPPWGGKRARDDPYHRSYQDLYQDRYQNPGQTSGRRPYQTEAGVWGFGPPAGAGYQRSARPRRGAVFSVAIGVIAVAVLAGAWFVTHRPLKAGPLGHPVLRGMECLGLAGHRVVTYGVEWVQNPGPAKAVIDQMTLAKSEGLRVVATWAVPTSGLAYGVQVGYPPSKMPLPGWRWARREPADGATVPYTPGRRNRLNLLLVLGLKPGFTTGQAAAVDLWYHVGSSRYHLRTGQRLVLQPGEVALPPC